MHLETCNWMCATELQENKSFGGQLEFLFFSSYPACGITNKRLYFVFSELKYRDFSDVWIALAGMGVQKL